MIPQIDLKSQYMALKKELDEALLSVAASGRYILGQRVEELEGAIAAYCGVRYGIGVASGTDALRLSLAVLDLSPGDEVITTPFSFIATVDSIAHTGATPIFVDIDPVTFNLNPDQLEAAITRRTKAILPVHLFGQSSDMSTIMEVAKAHDLAVIEDCAQAIGAEWKKQRVGSFGMTGAFSFFPTKNLGGLGDGGMIVTDDKVVADRLRTLRQHGAVSKYVHERFGFNSRLDELQAAVLLVKFKRLDVWTDRRQKIAAIYDLNITNPEVTKPFLDSDIRHVYNQYTIRSGKRDGLSAHLAENGVASAIYYPTPLDQQPAVTQLVGAKTPLAVVHQVSREVLSLPMFPDLSDEAALEVCAAVNSFRD